MQNHDETQLLIKHLFSQATLQPGSKIWDRKHIQRLKLTGPLKELARE